MQQIERVGVIALLLLIVTMVTVALWDDGAPTGPGKNTVAALSGKRAPASSALRPQDRGQRLPVNTERPRALPRRGQPERTAQPASYSPPNRARSVDRGAEARAYAKAQERAQLWPSRKSKSNGRASLTPVTTASPAPFTGQTYKVRSGDCLERIARRECGDRRLVRQIMSLNGITDPNRIKVGQTLRLPGSSKTAQAPAKKKPSTLPGVYVVQPRDTLSGISQNTLGTAKRWREFLEVNPGLDPQRLQVGANLRVPSSTLVASARGAH